jgi:hypothetical protein
MSVGGVGFQLTSYVIDAERGYLSRADAAGRTVEVLNVLQGNPQGPERVGKIGHEGFFYHFLGIDGLRKQNFDFSETDDVNESLNTVELSTIDTALAIAGVVTAGQYFDGNTVTEQEIRSLAEDIYSDVNWPFMLNEDPCHGQNQFFLGWKPNEDRDDESGRFGRFKLDDDPNNPEGQYSSKNSNGVDVPATIDFYTDEGLLIALLAMGSPNPGHRLGRVVWDATIRDDEGGSFIKTYPGALFTYQFGSVWLDTERLGRDTHPHEPVNFFENTQQAIQATRNYAISNPEGRATLNENRWGLSATEGPFDDYFADAAPDAAIHPGGNEPARHVFGSGGREELEGEDGTGDGNVMPRSEASGGQTVLLKSGETRSLSLELDGTALYDVNVVYSNDNFGPLELVEVSVNGELVGSFSAEDTGDGGAGWNVFYPSGPIGSKVVAPGMHEVTVSVSGGDGYGVEIDQVQLEPGAVQCPLELGTVTNYGVGSSIVHTPSEAIGALWNNAEHEDLNEDGTAELLHRRFGFADAFNLDIADAAVEGMVHPNEPRILRADGPWVNYTGLAIDHGPLLVMIDNYLNDQFIPHLFMSHPGIQEALSTLFMFGDLDERRGWDG